MNPALHGAGSRANQPPIRNISHMTLEQWAYLSTIGQFILIFASVAAIWYQLRLGVKLAKAANGQSLAAQAGAFNALLIQDAAVARIWYSHGKGLDEPTFGPAARERYREMLAQWLIIHENIYYQKEKGLMDTDLYASWNADLKRTIKEHDLRVFDAPIESIFLGTFGGHIVDIQKSL